MSGLPNDNAASAHGFVHPNESGEEFLQHMLSQYAVVLISATYCTFCARLKSLLMNEKIEFVALEINVLPNGRRVFESVVQRTQCHTVPQLFVKGEYVGGYDDLVARHYRGELDTLFGSAKRGKR